MAQAAAIGAIETWQYYHRGNRDYIDASAAIRCKTALIEPCRVMDSKRTMPEQDLFIVCSQSEELAESVPRSLGMEYLDLQKDKTPKVRENTRAKQWQKWAQ
jgi:hypothetical protein